MRFVLIALLALASCGDGDDELEAERRKVQRMQEELEAERLALREILEMREKELQEKRSGIKVNLPSGSSQEIDVAAISLVVEIGLDGTLVIAGKPVSDADLDRIFQSAYQRSKDTQVVLRAEKGVQHGLVVSIMERAKQAGLTRLAIQTRGAGP